MMRISWRSATRERPESSEVVRQFDIASAATVMSAFIGLLFLVFFLAAFLPWLLAKGMTSAVEGLMSRIGFHDFTIQTIWSWLLVLVIFAVFTAFIVAIATAVLYLYNLLAERTGQGFRLEADPLEAGSTPALSAPTASTEAAKVIKPAARTRKATVATPRKATGGTAKRSTGGARAPRAR